MASIVAFNQFAKWNKGKQQWVAREMRKALPSDRKHSLLALSDNVTSEIIYRVLSELIYLSPISALHLIIARAMLTCFNVNIHQS